MIMLPLQCYFIIFLFISFLLYFFMLGFLQSWNQGCGGFFYNSCWFLKIINFKITNVTFLKQIPLWKVTTPKCSITDSTTLTINIYISGLRHRLCVKTYQPLDPKYHISLRISFLSTNNIYHASVEQKSILK